MIYKPLRMRNIMFQIELRLRIEVYVPDNQYEPGNILPKSAFPCRVRPVSPGGLYPGFSLSDMIILDLDF